MKTKFQETEIGLIPEDWEYLTVQGLIDKEIIEKPLDGNHGSIHPKGNDFVSEGIPFISASDIKNGKIDFDSCKFITKTQADNLQKGFSRYGDVLITHKGVIGRTALIRHIKTDYVVLTPQITYYRIKNSQKLSNYFLKYFFDFSGFQQLFKSWAGSGTTRDYLGITEQRKLPIIIPPLLEQENISKILSDLDSKIELNQQMNKTLEAIGKAIFKHWFLNFEFPNEQGKPYKSSGGEMVYNEELEKEIPKDWEVVEFNKIVQLTMGLSPKGESYNTIEEGIPLINGAADFSDNLIIPKKFTTQPTRVCEKGDLLFCIRGTIGNLTYADKSYCLGRGVASVTAFNNNFTEYVFFILNQRLKEMISKASGSVIIGLSKPDILNLKIILPKENVINDFHIQSELIFMRLESIKIENYILSKIRDFLLPKLMSGKIRVPVEAN